MAAVELAAACSAWEEAVELVGRLLQVSPSSSWGSEEDGQESRIRKSVREI